MPNLYSITGALVYSNEFNTAGVEVFESINLEGKLAPGMYTLQLMNESKVQTQKIIVR